MTVTVDPSTITTAVVPVLTGLYLIASCFANYAGVRLLVRGFGAPKQATEDEGFGKVGAFLRLLTCAYILPASPVTVFVTWSILGLIGTAALAVKVGDWMLREPKV